MTGSDYANLLARLRHPVARIIPPRPPLPSPFRSTAPGNYFRTEDAIRAAERLPRIGQQAAARIAARIALPPVVAWLLSRTGEMSRHAEAAVNFYEDLLATTITPFDGFESMRQHHHGNVHRSLIHSLRQATRGGQAGAAANAGFTAICSALVLHTEEHDNSRQRNSLQNAIQRASDAYVLWRTRNTSATSQWLHAADFTSIWSTAVRTSLPVCFCHYTREDLFELISLLCRRWHHMSSAQSHDVTRWVICVAEQLVRPLADQRELSGDPRYLRTQHEVDAWISSSRMPSRHRWAATALATRKPGPYLRILLAAALALEPMADAGHVSFEIRDALVVAAELVSGQPLASDHVFTPRQVEFLAGWWQQLRRHASTLHSNSDNPLTVADGYAPVSG